MNFSVIFDMDGILVDSEPMWRLAEMETFKLIGVNLTDEMCHQTKGMRMDMVVDYWYKEAPDPSYPKTQFMQKLKTRVTELVEKTSEPMPGVIKLIETLKENHILMGLCSSSPMDLIEANIEKFGIKQYLTYYHSTENEIYAKPHPVGYLTTAKTMKVNPTNCIVFEDSVTGAIAGKAATMKVIAIPSENERDSRFDFCDLMLNSMTEVSLSLLENLAKQ